MFQLICVTCPFLHQAPKFTSTASAQLLSATTKHSLSLHCITQSPLEMITNSCKKISTSLVLNWFNTNLLNYKYMVASRKRKWHIVPTLLLNDHYKEKFNIIKYLGIILTNDLMWNRHVQTVSQRAQQLVETILQAILPVCQHKHHKAS